MLMMLASLPGDMFSLELGSDFRYVTGALLLISVIAIITFACAKDAWALWRAPLQLAAMTGH